MCTPNFKLIKTMCTANFKFDILSYDSRVPDILNKLRFCLPPNEQ